MERERSGVSSYVGRSEKLQAYWHLAVEFQASVGKQHRYTAMTHVVFTSDGKTLFSSTSQQHRLRRSFCKQWWQDRWRDLISAYLAKLSEQESILKISIAPHRTVTVSTSPLKFISPVNAHTEEEAASLEELHDDADLLYDPDADDDPQDDDDDASRDSE